MMPKTKSHPCSDHMAQCDHCFCCEVVGICCGTISPQARAQLEAAVQQDAQGDELRAAISAEAGTVPSLAELVRSEAATKPAAPLMLPPAAPLALPRAAEWVAADNAREEEPVYVYVQPARQAR